MLTHYAGAEEKTMKKNPSYWVNGLSVQGLRLWLRGINVVLFAWLFLFWTHQKVWRIDLTQDKRHTLSSYTKTLLKNAQDEVFVEVYLAGRLPAAFRRFKKHLKERLDDFSVRNGRFRYTFVDPSQASSRQARDGFFSLLMERGVQPTNLFYTDSDGSKIEKMVFPGALLHYQGKTRAVNFLESSKIANTEAIINQAIEEIEYRLVSAWQSLATTGKKHLGVVTSHSESDPAVFEGMLSALADYYRVSTPRLEALPQSDYVLIILADPVKALSARDLYLLDQYIMQGGRVLFFVEGLLASMEALNTEEGFVPAVVENNLGEMLFKYGVRINTNLIEDLRCAKYPVVVGKVGNQPNIQLLDWPFFMVLQGTDAHIITRKMGGVLSQFTASLDTIDVPGIKKTALLHSSVYTKIRHHPLVLRIEDFRKNFTPSAYRAGKQDIAYLLEGSFCSVYKNRILPDFAKQEDFLEEGTPTQLIVVGDSDIIKNEIHPKTKQAGQLGMYSPEQKKYANTSFLLNAVSYLTDAEGIITTRNKQVYIRPLDKKILAEKKQFLYVINLVVPIFLMTLLAGFKQAIRRKKYAN